MTTLTNASRSNRVILSLDGIKKIFGGTRALDGVSFDLRQGEIHALVGENGAGKSTLIKTISGAYTPDAGTITIDGATYTNLTPEQSRRLGVGVVYQEFNLLPDMPVAENIFLTSPPKKFGLIDTGKRAKQAYQLLKRLGAHKHIDPNELVKDLTVGEQQIVEIAKALATDARILIMDEPSAVLPSRDLDRLFSVIKTLRDEGQGIIYISHRLNEIFELADRVTVLKDGQTMATKNVAETNEDTLVHLMVGRELTDMYPPHKGDKPGEVLLEVRDLCMENTVFDINFQIRKGEVVGLAGLGGSGRTTVCRSLVGLGDIRSGQVLYRGQTGPRTPAAATKTGMVLIPEDRKAYGLILNQTTRFNLALPNLSQFERYGVLRAPLEKRAARDIIDDLIIRPPDPNILAENLSGGNQQKVVVGKWLLANPKLVIFDEPTRGIDIGAKAEIYARIRELSQQGVGVIMASSELPELIGMCDRILVFHEGRLAGELDRKDFSEEAIMRLATATDDNNVSVQ